MPKANNAPQPKPWYKKAINWVWIMIGAMLVAYIVLSIMADAEEERAKARRPKPRTYEEVFTPEECKKMGIGKKPDGPGDWKPDPNGAQKFREFIENGGNADPAIDAIQDGDYHDLLDQMGGEEGF